MRVGDGGTLVGQTLGGYRLTALLGVGSMAEVYRGEDIRLGRAVAVKVLPKASVSDGDFVRRFREEARRVAAKDARPTCHACARATGRASP